MVRKAPRRTAQRILETALDLFNRFGEPNVSTTLIAAELGISPGNLYYHYPAKDALINRLQQEHEQALHQALDDAAQACRLDDAAALVDALMALAWRYRFLYRDINDLLSRNRQFEARLQSVLREQESALRLLLLRLAAAGELRLQAAEADMLARNIVVLLSFWLSYEYAGNPREALEPPHAEAALRRGSRHTLQLLAPYLPPAQHQQWCAQLHPPSAQQDAPATA